MVVKFTQKAKMHWILIILPACFINRIYALPKMSNSGLCIKDPLPVSCSHQLSPELAQDSCLVDQIFRNHSTCKDWFSSSDRCDRVSGCGVVLQPFVDIYYKSGYNFTQVAFNVSFTELARVTHLRFERLDKKEFRFCRRFMLDELAITFQESPVWFDCLFHNHTYSSVEFALDFLVDGRSGRYVFIVPQENRLNTEADLESQEIFIYLHFNSLPKPVVSFQTLKGVNLYTVRIIRWENNFKDTLKTFIVDVRNPKTFAYNYKEIITFDTEVDLDVGNYSVEVELNDPNINGRVSGTPFFVVIDQKLPVMIVACVALFIVAALLLGFLFVVWKSSDSSKRGLLLPQDTKSILFLYDPVSAAHIKVVVALKHYLEEHYNLKVMLDIHDIPQTKHKDPFEWYSMAIHEADCVSIIVSPTIKPQLKEVPSVVDYSTLKTQTMKKRGENNEIIYQHTFSLGISLLISRIRTMMKEKNYNLDRFVVLIPPYSSETNIPPAGVNFRRFRISEQLSGFLKHIQHSTSCNNLERKRMNCFSNTFRWKSLNGIESSSAGVGLENAIKAAVNSVDSDKIIIVEDAVPLCNEILIKKQEVVADVENIHDSSSDEDNKFYVGEVGEFPPHVRNLPSLFNTS
ncbi:uncharacterized protein LOC136035560 [Artemia franciscana]|uniref:SEFIR domain-containing protein n=1 Tax=Artemia franciscana TaxID=6661 RepID=A0AA88L8M0_ARTSF|nr:hypothetical protein QYM36_003430 [Artemia franciscana]KAK2721153.1 hypothetical protein QYM36_003430 [Artemia franciscana]